MPRTRFTVKDGISVADDNIPGGYPLVPVGTVVPYAGSTAPEGWLLCDGRSTGILRTEYANLFAVIGTTYGAGNGSTTFNLPDMRGRMPIGAGAGAGLTTRALAGTGGAESVVISSANLPTHEHSLNSHTHTSAAHEHGLNSHTHGLGSHTHNANHGHNASSGGHSVNHAHNLPRSSIAQSGTNRAVVSSTSNQPTLFTEDANNNHSHTITVDGNNFSTGGPSAGSDGPSTANTTNVTPGATGGPSQTNTGNGGFANTAIATMNPFLALNYIIKF